MNRFAIIDLEFTTWDGAFARNWDGENEYREIVQIGALLVNADDFSVIDAMNLLVKPSFNPQLSDCFQELTHVTQEQVDRDGVSFLEAFDRLAEFCGKDIIVHSYGNDMVVLGENIGMHKSARNVFGNKGMMFVNLTPYIRRLDPGANNVNSGRLWQHFGLPKPDGADEHDALFDCYSILAAIKHMTAQGHVLPL